MRGSGTIPCIRGFDSNLAKKEIQSAAPSRRSIKCERCTLTVTTNTYRNYLRDLGVLVKDLAKAAKLAKDATPGGEDRAYAVGRLMALHEVISLMQQQAVAFDMPLEDVGLQGVDPESELI